MKTEKTPRQRIVENGDYYRNLVPGLLEALKNADKASYAGNLSYFVAALQDVSRKADTLGRTAATLAYLLERHGVQPRQSDTDKKQACYGNGVNCADRGAGWSCVHQGGK